MALRFYWRMNFQFDSMSGPKGFLGCIFQNSFILLLRYSGFPSAIVSSHKRALQKLSIPGKKCAQGGARCQLLQIG